MKVFVVSLSLVFSLTGLYRINSAEATVQCHQLFLLKDVQRAWAIGEPRNAFPLDKWMQNLRKSRRLVYESKTDWQPGTEFLASNEGDWHLTPFDHKAADFMIAFGTNSAWEIAVDKKVKDLVIADWSPYPLLTHALLIAPLVRISSSARDLVLLLGGYLPEHVSQDKPFDQILEIVSDQRLHYLDPRRIEALLKHFSSRPEIKDEELEFLQHYFWSRSMFSEPLNNPMPSLRHPMFANIPYFFGHRYRQIPRSTVEQLSVLHNPENFKSLKRLFDENRISYALAEITNLNFYQSLRAQYPKSSSMVLSVTNIFDMDYAGLSFRGFQTLLKSLIPVFSVSPKKPLVVFRTANSSPPHKFYRYELQEEKDVPAQEPAGDVSIPEWLKKLGVALRH
ncbi:MAG: hypothetical protein A4S09_04735 [Proteobacteria bacterium SG_bin7]|nr:MAG: hypothetical protein A4S09_04735 [Proteobacteria bacterium SG_bin7]